MAATWKIKRLAQEAGGELTLVCEAGQYPLTATMESDDGRTFTVTACVPLEEPDPCVILSNFTVPDGVGDWEGSCA